MIDLLAAAMNHDAWMNSERYVSKYHPARVRCMDMSHTAIADYEETTDDVFLDIQHEMLISELKQWA